MKMKVLPQNMDISSNRSAVINKQLRVFPKTEIFQPGINLINFVNVEG